MSGYQWRRCARCGGPRPDHPTRMCRPCYLALAPPALTHEQAHPQAVIGCPDCAPTKQRQRQWRKTYAPIRRPTGKAARRRERTA